MSDLSSDYVERYARHLVLKEIGGAGQAALSDAKVALIGAGGLGGPAGLYLAAAGIGKITLIDDDHVSLSNLQRQIQFQTDDMNQAKTDVMKTRLEKLNPNCKIVTHAARVLEATAKDLLDDHTLLIDGSDNFQTRFDINAYAQISNTPWISGSLGRFEGQVSAFHPAQNGPCYRCFVPELPPNPESCAQQGVIGALAGMIGSVMALEAIKIITGAGEPLFGRIYLYDGLKAQGRTIVLPKDPNCPHCH